MAERSLDIYPMKCTVVLAGETGEYLEACLRDSLGHKEAPIYPSYLSLLSPYGDLEEDVVNAFLSHTLSCDKVVVYLDRGMEKSHQEVVDLLLDLGHDIYYRFIE